jgi:chitodextrinase
MIRRCISLFFIMMIFTAVIFTGCSGAGGSSVVAPQTSPASQPPEDISKSGHDATGTRILGGLWQFEVDPETATLIVTPLREAMMHLNALPFLEPPPLYHLTIEGPIEFNGNLVDIDIGLRHPFPGLKEFTGFDVRGILITSGNKSGFQDTGIRYAGPGATRLLNADGLTRWWNPREFPYAPGGEISSYVDGLLGSPDSKVHFSSTINGFKYYSDDLGVNDGLDKLNPEHRGYFTAGKKNVRHYTIELGSAGLVFNYAVDASWEFPLDNPPNVNVPGSFGLEANAPEPYWVEIKEISNDLWRQGSSFGGLLVLEFTIHSFRNNANVTVITTEAPGYFIYTELVHPDGDGFLATGIGTLAPLNLPNDEVTLLIGVESPEMGYQDNLPGKPVASYYLYTADISPTKPNKPPVALAQALTPTKIIRGGFVAFDGSASYDPDGTITKYEWEADEDNLYDDATGAKPIIQFNNVGAFHVDLRVTDDQNATDTLDQTIEVNVSPPNEPPVALAQATSATTIEAGKSVSFNGSASYDPDGIIVKYEWEMGDDSLYDDGSGKTCSIQFNTAGDYYVDLRVTDDDNATDTLDIKIHITVYPKAFYWDPENPDPPPFQRFLYSFVFCTTFHQNWGLRYDPPGGLVYGDGGPGHYWDESGTYGTPSSPEDMIHAAYQFNTLVTDVTTIPNVPGNVTLSLRHYIDLLYDDILGGEYLDGAQVRIATNTSITIWDTPDEVKAQTTLLYPASGPAYGIIGSTYVNNYLNGQMGFRGPLDQWYTSTFNLNAYKGQQVRLGYVFSSGFYAIMGGCNWNGSMDYRYGVRVGRWEIKVS